MSKTIVRRYEGNPVVRPEDIPINCFAAYNGGAVKINNEYILSLRVEDMARNQYIWAARSKNGKDFTPDPEPMLFTATDTRKYEKYAHFSFYDPRINPVEGRYYITYAASSNHHGCRVGLGITEDFKTISHISFPLHMENRNAVLFPEKMVLLPKV